MTSNLNLPDRLLVDSRLLVSSSKSVEIRRGAANTTTQRTTANSLSNAQIIWTPQLASSDNTIIDPYCYAEYNMTATVLTAGLVGPNTTKNYVNNNFSLRQYPMASVMNTCQVTVNQQMESSQPSQFIHQLGWFQNFLNAEDQQVIQSLGPIYPDQSPQYSDLVGSNKSPLLNYASGGEHYSESRGSFNQSFVDVVNATNTWTFTFTVREPIYCPLLDYDPLKQREGLPYVNRFQVQINFLSNLSRMFSLDAVTCPAVTSITVNINSANLVQKWLTSPLTQALPEVAIRGYNRIVVNQTNLQQVVNAGQQITVTSNALQMGQIAEKIWIYVNNQANYDIPTGHSFTDWNFSIQSVSILFNNVAGIMSDMFDSDLYIDTNAEESSKMSFEQFKHQQGSILCIDPVKLFRLQANESAGMLGQYQLVVNITCTNISNAAVTNPAIYIATALPTLLTTTNNYISTLIQGYITKEDVMRSNSLPAHPISTLHDGVYGGSFGDMLKRGLAYIKEHKLISKALPHLAGVPGVGQFVPAAQALASSFGYGGRKTSRRELMQASLRY